MVRAPHSTLATTNEVPAPLAFTQGPQHPLAEASGHALKSQLMAQVVVMEGPQF